METMLLYLLKSSGIIAVFYLAYYFLLRKETFFNSNRWFLLSGLITSLLLPLVYFKKIIVVERPKISIEDLVAYSQVSTKKIQDVPVAEAFDWLQFIWVSYAIIVCVLVIKILLNLSSLYRMLYQQQVVRKESFKLINLNENIAPFSFFNYIVFNSDLYTHEELQSILLHEKIHSQEKHSLDVLVAKLFCIVFWFNPFVWLYKKAITQNLEYIADQKSIEQLEDKKSYQKALLKVVSNQNCLSITNNFYQPCLPAGRSLIKKRIVMLNTNQSNKSKSWKYTLIIPVLIGFIFLFQIKTIAQERKTSSITSVETHEGADITFDAKESDESLKTLKNVFNEEKIVTEISKVKRNSIGEIIGICIKMKSEDGRKKELKINQNNPIDEIFIYTKRMENGQYDFGIKHLTKKEVANVKKQVHNAVVGLHASYNNQDPNEYSFSYDFELPELPEAPESPNIPEWNKDYSYPKFPDQLFDNLETHTIFQKGGEAPIIVVNGRIISGDLSILNENERKDLDKAIDKQKEDNKRIIVFNNGEMSILDTDNVPSKRKREKEFEITLNRLKSLRPELIAKAKEDIERVREVMKKARPELERAKEKIENSRTDIEKERAEMIKAKEEMIKAKEELIKAKAELEKEKAALKKNNQ